MTIAYATPGVYYERGDASAPAVLPMRTDVTGFVGIASQGPTDTPVPIQSFRQFQAYFGSFTGSGYLAYAVWAFFQNGGAKCWVVRVSSFLTTPSLLSLADIHGNPAWNIIASGPGVWGNALDIALQQTHRGQTMRLASAPMAPNYVAVTSVAGFVRGTLAMVTQDGTAGAAYKVVSDVDAANKILYWVNLNPARQLPYDGPLTGFSTTRALLIQSIEYTILVRLQGQLIRTYQTVSLVPEHPNYGPTVLGPLVINTGPGQSARLPLVPEPIMIQEQRNLSLLPINGFAPLDTSSQAARPMIGGADGLAALSVYDFIGESLDPLDSPIEHAEKCRGLRALELVDEVAILAVPDIQIRPEAPPTYAAPARCVPDPCLPGPSPIMVPPTPPVGDLPPIFNDQQIYQVQAAQIEQAERLSDRFALLDAPFDVADSGIIGGAAVQAWRSRFESKFAAFYYPWMRVVDPLFLSSTAAGPALTRDIPPCGHVAGQYANTDLTQGVFKAPANAPLVWTQDVTDDVSDALHGILNPMGINVIRKLPGRGIRIFGARTVSSDPDWRFVNVRRLVCMIEKAIQNSIQWAVFEPNDDRTRAKLRTTLTSFLLALWEHGALIGGSPAAAFKVICDASNNPDANVEDGQLVADIGIAPSVPFEFVIVRIGRTGNDFQVTEVASQ